MARRLPTSRYDCNRRSGTAAVLAAAFCALLGANAQGLRRDAARVAEKIGPTHNARASVQSVSSAPTRSPTRRAGRARRRDGRVLPPARGELEVNAIVRFHAEAIDVFLGADRNAGRARSRTDRPSGEFARPTEKQRAARPRSKIEPSSGA